MTGVQWNGEEDAVIAYATDPWLQKPDGDTIDLTAALSGGGSPFNTCDTCGGLPVPGILAGHDSGNGIERCDECERYPGDLEAAQHLAKLIGGGATVWYEPHRPPLSVAGQKSGRS